MIFKVIMKYNFINKSIILISFFFGIFLNQESNKVRSSEIIKTSSNKIINEFNNEKNIIESQYILGSGDILFINFNGLNIFSNLYAINPDGFLNLPEIGEIKAAGYTKNELKRILLKEYKQYIIDPILTINIHRYREITIYLGGEVNKPGLYKIGTEFRKFTTNKSNQNDMLIENDSATIEGIPRLFDALKFGEGITNFADLEKIRIIRKNSLSQGGGKIETTVNFLDLLEKGNQVSNIRIYDGDAIFVPKSDKLLTKKLIEINKTNITPDEMKVFVSGNVNKPGTLIIKQGATLVQAIAASGGDKYFTGKVRHVRFTDDGLSKKRVFNYDPNAKIASYKNPILIEGDIVYVDKSIVGKTSTAIKEFSQPILGIYTLLNIF